jgi:hypothetical protein
LLEWPRAGLTFSGIHFRFKVRAMRTVLIVATVAIGAMRLMWRRLGPPVPLESATEWTADE